MNKVFQERYLNLNALLHKFTEKHIYHGFFLSGHRVLDYNTITIQFIN